MWDFDDDWGGGGGEGGGDFIQASVEKMAADRNVGEPRVQVLWVIAAYQKAIIE